MLRVCHIYIYIFNIYLCASISTTSLENPTIRQRRVREDLIDFLEQSNKTPGGPTATREDTSESRVCGSRLFVLGDHRLQWLAIEENGRGTRAGPSGFLVAEAAASVYVGKPVICDPFLISLL